MTTPKRLLIVDDDADLRAVLRCVCEDAGYAVECAEHGREALALLGAGPTPSLILLDVIMPVLDGWGFLDARRLDAERLKTPVVMVSATAGRSRVAPYADVAAVLAKPVDLDTLLATVARYAR